VAVALACPATAKTPPVKRSDATMNAALGSFFTGGKPHCFLESDVARKYWIDAECVPSFKNAKREIGPSNIRKNLG
jgi:hypothetical protein